MAHLAKQLNFNRFWTTPRNQIGATTSYLSNVSQKIVHYVTTTPPFQSSNGRDRICKHFGHSNKSEFNHPYT